MGSLDLIRDVADALRHRQPEMVRLLRSLVERESPSDDFGAVDSFADFLSGEMEALGFVPRRTTVPGAPSLIECDHGGTGKPVLLLGHMDTVWSLGTLARRPVRIDGDLFYGPGAYDMKAGLVVALHAVAALGDSCSPVHMMWTSQEEVSPRPYRALLEERAAASAAVIGLEPAWPGGAVKTQRKGCGSVIIRARGKAAHAGADPERGVNAIVEISEQVARLKTIQSELGNGVTLNVGLVRGGTRSNVVPDFAEISVDLRFRRLSDGREALRRLREMQPVLPGAALEVQADIAAPPLERTEGVQRLFAIASRVQQALGGEPLREVSTGGASEVSYAAACGVPAIDGFGADGDGAHAENEHVKLSSLHERAALLAGTLLLIAEAED